MKIGFIGVGIMGSPMARNVLKGGFDLVVYDTSRDAVQVLVNKGANSGESPKDVASVTDVIITMLPMPSDVENVVLGVQGIIDGVKEGSIYIDMSTGDPVLAKRIADELEKLGVATLDCPVGGGKPEAIAGSLFLMAGGEAETIENVRPLLECMGKSVIHCGGSGTGQVMKLTNNMLGAMTFQATTEALSLGMKFGIELKTMLAVLSNTAASNALITRVLPGKAFKGDYQPGFTLRLTQKDLGLALDLAKKYSVPIPLAAQTLQRVSQLISSGYGDLDIGAFIKAQADLLDLSIQLDE